MPLNHLPKLREPHRERFMTNTISPHGSQAFSNVESGASARPAYQGYQILHLAFVIGAWIVAAWLWPIIINVLLPGYFDIALRDFGLTLGAVALARLSNEFLKSNVPFVQISVDMLRASRSTGIVRSVSMSSGIVILGPLT